MSLQSTFKKPDLLDWQKKMGIYVSAIMTEVLASYQVLTEKETYLEGLENQMEQLKKDTADATIQEINFRKEGEALSFNFLKEKEERAAGIIRLGGALKRWGKQVDDAQDRMRRLSLLWKQAGNHYKLQMETYKSDDERREEKRYMDEKRIVDEQMRKIAFDEKKMRERAEKLKARMAKEKPKHDAMVKRESRRNKEAYDKMIEASFDKNKKLLGDYYKTDVVKNPPPKKELNMGAIGASMGDTPRSQASKPDEKSGSNKLQSAAKNMGLS